MSDGHVGPTVLGPDGEDLLVSTRLGWLYLEQDHCDEAEEIFRAALAWEPDDREARRGLEATLRRRREQAGEQALELSHLEARIACLRLYLKLIRRAASEGEAGRASPPSP